jgi:hypothetical protein
MKPKKNDFSGFRIHAFEKVPDEFDSFRPPKIRKLDLDGIRETTGFVFVSKKNE